MAAKTEKGLKQEIVNLFPVRLRQILEALPLDFARLEEIRLRCGQPILFRIAGKEMGITGSGDLTELGSSGKLENWEKLEKIREKEPSLTREDEMAEFMFLGLRMTQGVSKKEFQEYFGTAIENIYGEVLKKYKKQGLLLEESGRIFLSREGIHVSNAVMADFLL